MEGLHKLQAQLHRRDHIRKVDVPEVYMHLLIAEKDCWYFCFLFDGIKHECTAMPFGLGQAPRIARKFLLPAIQYLRRWKIRCTAYIHDVWGCARSRMQAV